MELFDKGQCDGNHNGRLCPRPKALTNILQLISLLVIPVNDHPLIWEKFEGWCLYSYIYIFIYIFRSKVAKKKRTKKTTIQAQRKRKRKRATRERERENLEM